MNPAASEGNGILLQEQTFYILSPATSEAQSIVVFIHGIGGYHGQFEHTARALEKNGYRTLLYDLIGRGSSPVPEDKEFSVNSHVSQLENLLKFLEISKAHFVSHSMGGIIASAYGAAHPDSVLSLTLLAPAGLIDLPCAVSFLRHSG